MNNNKHGPLILVLLVIVLTLSLSSCHQMTDEERAQRRAERTHTYELLSVNHYVAPVTNRVGGVVRTETRYTFTYIDGNGGLCIEDDFQHLEYGMTKIMMGESNQYVTVDGYRYLYLTKETVQTMEFTGGILK